jgi:hypothetical protein
MIAEDRWGADTVALGQRSKDEEGHPAPRRRRVSRPRRIAPVVRVILVSALALAVGVAGVSLLDRGAEPEPAPIHESVDPVPRAARRPVHSGLLGPRDRRRGKHQSAKGGLAEHHREPKETARVRQAPPPAVSSLPAPPAEAPVVAPTPEATPAPTPPTAEFGL